MRSPPPTCSTSTRWHVPLHPSSERLSILYHGSGRITPYGPQQRPRLVPLPLVPPSYTCLPCVCQNGLHTAFISVAIFAQEQPPEAPQLSVGDSAQPILPDPILVLSPSGPTRALAPVKCWNVFSSYDAHPNVHSGPTPWLCLGALLLYPTPLPSCSRPVPMANFESALHLSAAPCHARLACAPSDILKLNKHNS